NLLIDIPAGATEKVQPADLAADRDAGHLVRVAIGLLAWEAEAVQLDDAGDVEADAAKHIGAGGQVFQRRAGTSWRIVQRLIESAVVVPGQVEGMEGSKAFHRGEAGEQALRVQIGRVHQVLELV